MTTLKLHTGDLWLINEIIERLRNKLNISNQQANEMIYRSNFLRLLKEFPEQVHHDSVSGWVDSIARQSKQCKCGRPTESIIGTRTFHIHTRKITVNNLPYNYCSYCDSASYGSITHIDDVLKDAYLNQRNEVDYEPDQR